MSEASSAAEASRPVDGLPTNLSPDDPAAAVMASVMALVRNMRRDFPAWLPSELTIGQLRLLARLHREGPSSMGAIAEWLGIGLPAVSGIVLRLERHGLAQRRHDGGDRRIVNVHLTDRTRELLAETAGVRIEAARSLIAVLRPDELADLARILQAIADRTTEGTAQ